MTFALVCLASCSGAKLDEDPAGPDMGVTRIPAADCVAGEWCWMKGRPLEVQGDRRVGTVFAFGAEGEFLRWSVEGWLREPLPVRQTIRSAWVPDASTAWATDDDGRVWRFADTRWKDVSGAVPFGRVLGASDDSVWAIGGATPGAHGADNGAHLYRWLDDKWIEPAPPYPYCLGGAFLVIAADDIWSAGLTCDDQRVVDGAEVRRFDGTNWQLVGARIPQQGWFPALELVGGRVRMSATTTHEWDGTEWLPVMRPGYPQDLTVEQEAFWDGLGQMIVPRSLRCDGVFRLDDDNVWCFGQGQIHRQLGDAWVKTITNDFASTAPAEEWGSLPPELWAGGDTKIAWGTGPENVYRARSDRDSRLEHFDGATWTIILDAEVLDMHGTAADDVWFATSGGVYHSDGLRLTSVPVPDDVSMDRVTQVHAIGAGTVLAVTELALLQFDGEWSIHYQLPDRWQVGSIAGLRPDKLWLGRYRIGRPFDYAVDRYENGVWTEYFADDYVEAGVVSLDRRAWLYADGKLSDLEADEPEIVLPGSLGYGTSWLGAGAAWLTTDWQARRLIR